MTDSTTSICPWCSTTIPAGATACPKCGAAVEGAAEAVIPGVTVPDPKASFGPDTEGFVPDFIDPHAWLEAGRDDTAAEEEAIQPPSEAVRLEMRKMELEAEIENAGGTVMNPTGDMAINVGRPSKEALEALKDGLLDKTGPAGETDLAERAAEWERH